jgi:hydroxymethylpyrimidine/phosphomethylpyrimidine kinase
MKRILTIAASDSGGGAGIQADVKTITLLGAYGMSVITAVTAQNTRGIKGIQEIPVEFIDLQLDAVLSDIGADAVKTGMLVNAQVVRAVVRKIRQYRLEKVVVDPVMLAKSGDQLLNEEGRIFLKKELIPLAYFITPNLLEASILCRQRILDLEGMKEAARLIKQMGAQYVLIKGGHLKRKAIDLLFDGKEFFEFSSEKIKTKNTHGTGCILSAAIATFLGQDFSVHEAVKKAKLFITDAIRFGLNLGTGNGPANLYAAIGREMEEDKIVKELKVALKRLKSANIGNLIPEVQTNLGFALPAATTLDQVFAFPGRIMRFKDSFTTLADPEPGASRHIASVILAVMKYNPEFRSAMNIRFDPDILSRCKRLGFSAIGFNREDEPKRTKTKEGASLRWGVEKVLEGKKRMPDIIYDRGGMGKEPMIRVIGRTPLDVAEKIIKIAGER